MRCWSSTPAIVMAALSKTLKPSIGPVRAIKRIVRPMMGFKSFWSAASVLAGIETTHMIRKGQLACSGRQTASAADQFYSLAHSGANTFEIRSP
jgi:hypothetical protein